MNDIGALVGWLAIVVVVIGVVASVGYGLNQLYHWWIAKGKSEWWP